MLAEVLPRKTMLDETRLTLTFERSAADGNLSGHDSGPRLLASLSNHD